MRVESKTAVLRVLLVAAVCAATLAAIVFGAMLHRGFRATTAPTWLEIKLARAVRNFAIPASERNAKNPLPRDSIAVQQGREYFLTQCSGCHS